MAMPLADATAIQFTSPIITALLSPLVLRELGDFELDERLVGGVSIDAHGTALTDEVLTGLVRRVDLAVRHHSSFFDNQSLLADTSDRRHIVTDKQNRAPFFANLAHLLKTLLLKLRIADRLDAGTPEPASMIPLAGRGL